jgi:hypothetical protein
MVTHTLTQVESCRPAHLVFDLALTKRRAGKAEMNLVGKSDHRVTSKP